MSKRKHATEFAILSFADKTGITQQNWLDEVSKFDFDPHIYIIARRPKMSLEPGSFKITESTVSGILKIHGTNEPKLLPFETNNLLGTAEITLECNYPYTEFKLLDKRNGSVISEMQAATILTQCSPDYWTHLDLEVLYVGQSLGHKQKRNAVDRLKSHETLQNIYSEAMRGFPDQDIWLVLLHFTPISITSISTHGIELPITDNDNEHIKKISTPKCQINNSSALQRQL